MKTFKIERIEEFAAFDVPEGFKILFAIRSSIWVCVGRLTAVMMDGASIIMRDSDAQKNPDELAHYKVTFKNGVIKTRFATKFVTDKKGRIKHDWL